MHLNCPLQVLDCLKAGRQRLLRGWTQGACARDKSGEIVDPLDPSACCWCLFGACYVRDDEFRTEVIRFLNSIVRQGAILWQDAPGRTAEEVIQIVDRAISLCEEQCLAG